MMEKIEITDDLDAEDILCIVDFETQRRRQNLINSTLSNLSQEDLKVIIQSKGGKS